MAGNSKWTQTVKKAFALGRKTNKNYTLKEAMFAAKKMYKVGNVAPSKSRRRTRRH